MSDSAAMRLLDIDRRTLQRWRSGERDIPLDVASWLEGLVEYYRMNPPPTIKGRPRGFSENYD